MRKKDVSVLKNPNLSCICVENKASKTYSLYLFLAFFLDLLCLALQNGLTSQSLIKLSCSQV